MRKYVQGLHIAFRPDQDPFMHRGWIEKTSHPELPSRENTHHIFDITLNMCVQWNFTDRLFAHAENNLCELTISYFLDDSQKIIDRQKIDDSL